MFRPQVVLPPNFYPTFRLIKPKWSTYGFGWFQHDYRGEKVDLHTGSIDGRTAIVGLMRDKNVGVYVFGNLDHAEARHAIVYKTFDLLVFNDSNGRDWNAEFQKLYSDMAADRENRVNEMFGKKLIDTKPSLPLASYAGTYSDPLYGSVEITFTDGKLRLKLSKELSGELSHRHVDTFTAKLSKTWWGEELITFQLNPITGDVVSLSMDNQTFRRQG
jgi:hypothetical protein